MLERVKNKEIYIYIYFNYSYHDAKPFIMNEFIKKITYKCKNTLLLKYIHKVP